MSSPNEAFSRVKIDKQLNDVGWNTSDGMSVKYEVVLPDGGKADYVLYDRNGRPLAVVEAKRASINPVTAEEQARRYATQMGVPFIFLANGESAWFWDYEREAHPHPINTIFAQGDLERRVASRLVQRDPLTVPIDLKIAGRPYQIECIDTLCQEMALGRRKLLVEMATGTGKTRTAAALVKRLFEAHQITRVLFLVDRIPLATQADEAFTDYLPEIPSYVQRQGKGFQDEKRITITTLQSMINVYDQYSSGYFDLIIIDECHRSIYGQWSRVLNHFDGVKIGLTATPTTISDPDALPDPEDGKLIRDTLRFFGLERPTFSYGLGQAIREKFLVPYHIYKAQTVKTAANDGFTVTRDEIAWNALASQEREELERLFGAESSLLINPVALERKFTIPERNRAMVREFHRVLRDGFINKYGVELRPKPGKTIVFAVNKQHAVTLAHMFDEEFATYKPDPTIRYADYVVSGMGNEDTTDASARITRFKKEQFPQILVSVNMLDTGFDHPDVVNLIMARYTYSAVLYQQMRGRGTRRADHIGKDAFTLFDFVGITDLHQDDEDLTIEGGLVLVREAKQRYAPRHLLTLDVDDHIDPATRDWLTLDEQGRLVPSEATAHQGTLYKLRFEAWLAEQDLTLEQNRILKIIAEQIKANATNIQRWDIARFTRPPFSSQGGLARARQAFGGDEPLQQIIESLNRALFTDAA